MDGLFCSRCHDGLKSKKGRLNEEVIPAMQRIMKIIQKIIRDIRREYFIL